MIQLNMIVLLTCGQMPLSTGYAVKKQDWKKTLYSFEGGVSLILEGRTSFELVSVSLLFHSSLCLTSIKYQLLFSFYTYNQCKMNS